MHEYQITDPLHRLQIYWILLSYTETGDIGYAVGIPISEIVRRTQIPYQIVRQDMAALTEYPANNLLEPDEEHPLYENLNTIYKLEEKWYSPEYKTEIAQLFRAGILDELPLFIISREVIGFCLPLTPDEYEAVNHIRQDLSIQLPQEFSGFLIKDSFRTQKNPSFPSYLQSAFYAIQDGRSMHMRYQTAKNKILEFDFKPLKIAYDSLTSTYAILTIYADKIQVYRFDRILNLKECTTDIKIPDTSLLDIYPNVWGFSFNSDPYQVKIRFYNEGNVWKKVSMDLALRTNGRLYKKDGFLYYEDTVYGIDSFRSWIYSYGSSAIVIAPKKLREQIICSLELRQSCSDS